MNQNKNLICHLYDTRPIHCEVLYSLTETGQKIAIAAEPGAGGGGGGGGG